MTARFAKSSDIPMIHKFRNDEITRKASYNTGSVSLEEYTKYYMDFFCVVLVETELLNSRDCLFVLTLKQTIDSNPGHYTIGYFMNPEYRGKRLSSACLSTALDFVEDYLKIKTLTAMVAVDNTPSHCVMKRQEGWQYDSIGGHLHQRYVKIFQK